MSKTYSDPPKLIQSKELPCSINFNAQWWQDYVPSPDNVINALINNGYNCSNYKLFDRSTFVLDILKQYNLNVVVAFNNWELSKIIYEQNFINNEIQKLLPYQSIIECIAVGNEPLGFWYNGEFDELLVPAMKIVSDTLKYTFQNIYLTVPFNFAIFDNTYPPSQSIVLPSIHNIVFDTLSIMKNHSNNARTMVNIYPYLTHVQHADLVDLSFALGYKSLYYVRDGQILYTSLFDMMYDGAVVAFQKLGFDLPVDIGEVGWPDDGGMSANREYECLALNNLHISSTIGTPRQPGPIRVYYFEAIDEPWKEIGPGLTERHWGILTLDLEPKCPNRNNIIYKSTHPQENVFSNLWLLPLLSLALLPLLLIKKYKKSFNKVKNNYMAIPPNIQLNL
jgi:hypothetical protein|tara:strand:- start:1700 stop:2878 length:1179 start_codon:yes stop_codon:yes gene_type:complete